MKRAMWRVFVAVFGVAPATVMALLATMLAYGGFNEIIRGNAGGSLLLLGWVAGAFYGYAALWMLLVGRYPPSGRTLLGLICGIAAAAPPAIDSGDRRWQLICAAPIAIAIVALLTAATKRYNRGAPVDRRAAGQL